MKEWIEINLEKWHKTAKWQQKRRAFETWFGKDVWMMNKWTLHEPYEGPFNERIIERFKLAFEQ